MWSVSTANVSAGVSLIKSEGESIGANQVEELSLQKPHQAGWCSPKQRPGLSSFRQMGRGWRQDARIRNSIVILAVNLLSGEHFLCVRPCMLTHVILTAAL